MPLLPRLLLLIFYTRHLDQSIMTFCVILWLHNLKSLLSIQILIAPMEWMYLSSSNPASTTQRGVWHDLAQDDSSLYWWTYYGRNERGTLCCPLTAVRRLWHEHSHTWINKCLKGFLLCWLSCNPLDTYSTYTVQCNVLGTRDIAKENTKDWLSGSSHSKRGYMGAKKSAMAPARWY